MSTVQATVAVREIWTERNSTSSAITRITHNVSYTNGIVASRCLLQIPCRKLIFPSCGFQSTWQWPADRLWRTSKEGITKDCVHQWQTKASSTDQDYHSSRNIAISLFKRYRNVIDRGGGDNLKEFISAGVNAYSLGCTDEGLRKELMNLKDSGTEIEGLQTYGGRTSVTFKIISEEVHECILWLSIVFITILCTPQPTVIRWSPTQPVSTETMHQWRGFCAIIADAYYVRGMAWLPVKVLQLEQMVVAGKAEPPSVVSSRMRLVFSTLEVVSPQWPKV